MAEPPIPQTTRPPGSVAGGHRRRLHPPQRVADLLRLRQHVGEHRVELTRAPPPAGPARRPRSPPLHRSPRPRPRSRPRRSARRSPTRTPRASTASRIEQSAPTITRSCSTERSTAESLPTEQCVAEHRLRADVRAAGEAALADQRAGLVARRQRGADPARRAGRRWPPGSARASRCRPSSRRPRSRTATLLTSPGNTSRSKETARPGLDRLDHRALEHVRAGVDAVGRRRPVGLLEERLDPAVRGRSAPRRSWRCPPPRSAPAWPCARGLVLGELRGEVHVGEHVAVEHEQRARRAAPRRSARRTGPAVPSGSSSTT